MQLLRVVGEAARLEGVVVPSRSRLRDLGLMEGRRGAAPFSARLFKMWEGEPASGSCDWSAIGSPPE